MYIFIIILLYYAWQIAGSRKGADKKEFGTVPNSFCVYAVNFADVTPANYFCASLRFSSGK